MSGLDIYPHDPSSSSTSCIDLSNEAFFSTGGLFLEPPGNSSSFFDSISSKCSDSEPLHFPGYWRNKTRLRSGKNFMFLSVSLSKDRSEQQCKNALAQNDEIPVKDNGKRRVIGGVRRRGTMNTRKHLWAGAVAAMVSKYIYY